jgi:dTDP-glucose pyrophosphorylase
MNILIPIAGINTKMEDSQYIKSLYEIEHKIVIQYVYESLNAIEHANFIVIIKREDVKNFHLDDTIRLLIPDVKIIIAEGSTQGSTCSCMLAVDYIDGEEPLLISGCDQLITTDWNDVIKDFESHGYDGGVVYFDAIHPKWSYVKLGEDGFVIEAAEKRPISRNATTGQYYYKKGSDFVYAAEEMIKKGASINDQYYVCPTYNELVLKQKKIGAYQISKEEYFSFKDQKGMDEYEEYLKKEKCACIKLN